MSCKLKAKDSQTKSLETPVIASSPLSYSTPVAPFFEDPPDVIEINRATVGKAAPNMAMGIHSLNSGSATSFGLPTAKEPLRRWLI